MANENNSITLDIWDKQLIYLQQQRRFIVAQSHLKSLLILTDSDKYFIFNKETLNKVTFNFKDDVSVDVTTSENTKEKKWSNLNAKHFHANENGVDYSLVILIDI